MGPSMVVVEGSTTKAGFETYAERVLASALTPGQVVVMDNLSPTRGLGLGRLGSWSRVGAASFCTCRPTRRTSTP
jgi:hypothetical protein